MAALLVGMSVMAVMISVALPVWQTAARREREAELVFRGEQYARAVSLYQRARGGFPPSVDVLVNERFLRKKYTDPMAADGQFQVLVVGQPLPGEGTAPAAAGRRGGTAARGAPESLARGTGGGSPVSAGAGRGASPGLGLGQQGGGPVLGVVSKSTQESLRRYNGRTRYNEWTFVGVQATQQGGARTGGPQAGPGGRGGPQGRGGQGRGELAPGGRGGDRGQGPQLPAPAGRRGN